MRRLLACLLAALTTAALTTGLAGPAGAGGSDPRPPASMASIGDSMTRAADVCCWYGDHPANSWSTGWAGWDGVTSHYERLLRLNPNIAGRNYNDARSGARMSDGPGQAAVAVSQRVGYVTILLGANDLCTSSPTTMTSVADFRAQFRQTLATLDQGLPRRATVFVASIPDVHQLWLLYRDDLIATTVWDLANICQSLLGPTRTDADRQAVRDRNAAFNNVLAEECGAVSRCRFDGYATYRYAFGRSDVSKLDYFHPSLVGQAHLADVTWATTWWG